MRAGVLAVILTAAAALSVSAYISRQCEIYNGRKITCSCIGNEMFLLPEEYNYTNVVSLTVAGCASVNLHYSSLPEAINLEEVIVQNISGCLDFNIYIASNRIKMLRLSDIGRIPLIASHTFINVESIDKLMIENVHIDEFEEDFAYLNVSLFIMRNVVIERMDRLNLENSTTLYIRNSELRNIATSLTVTNIRFFEIFDSKFRLQRPGLISVLGNIVTIRNSVFSNASMSLNAASTAKIYNICADGKSTLRLSSKHIESINNQLPNEIVYLTRDNQPAKSGFFVNRNNTVCKAGNCKCPKSIGQASCPVACVSLLVLGCLLTSLFRRPDQLVL